MNAVLALAPAATWSLGEWLIFIVIIAAVIGVVVVALNYFGLTVPPPLLKILGIVVVAAVAILAIRFLLSL